MGRIITNSFGGFSTTRLQKLNAVRFNPGYGWNPKLSDQDNGTLDINGNIAAASWQTLLNKIDPYSAILFLSWRTSWIELETADGVYGGIAALKKRCEDLAAINKRFIVHFITRTFDGTRAAPTWARNATYDGGDHAYGVAPAIEGYNLNWYDPNVQAKMTALAAQIATELGVYPNFEGVILMESAYGARIIAGVESALSTAQVDAHFAGQLAFVTAVKTARPDLMVTHYSNVRTRNETHIPNLVAAGVGVGGPDCWVKPQGDPNASPVISLNDTVWYQTAPQGLYLHFHDQRNVVPLTIHLQPKNLRNSTKNGDNVVPTIQQLFDAAKTGLPSNLQVTYFILTDDNGGDAIPGGGTYPDFSVQILVKLDEPGQKVNAAGGLNTTKPSKYQSVITGAW